MTTEFLGYERAAPRGASSRSAFSSKLANGPIARDMASPPVGTARSEILARPGPIVASAEAPHRTGRPPMLDCHFWVRERHAEGTVPVGWGGGGGFPPRGPRRRCAPASV